MDTSIITPPVESLHSPELNNIISNAEPPRPRDEPPESEASEMETQMSTSRITHPVDLGGGDFILRVSYIWLNIQPLMLVVTDMASLFRLMA